MTCTTGKIGYTTRGEADGIARRIHRRKRSRKRVADTLRTGEAVHAYHCSHCGLWHLGRKF